MKLIAQTDINWGGSRYRPGDELDVPDDLGEVWVKRGAATRPEAPKPAVSRSAPRPVTPEE